MGACSPADELDEAPNEPVGADESASADGDDSGDGDPAPGDVSPGDGDPVAPPTLASLVGIYNLSGTEPHHGAYSGLVELRLGEAPGTYRVIHLAEWTSARFETLGIAQAWEGSARGAAAPFSLEASLSTVAFMTHYGETSRAGASGAPYLLTATLTPSNSTTLTASYSDGASETWTYARPSASAPIWKNLRTIVPAHEPQSESEKATLRALYDSFYELPVVVPYVGRPEFDAAINYWVDDRTDYDYLRAHPTTVRVLQAVVDEVSLAEARSRHRAYSHSLAAKAAAFDAVAPQQHLNGAGMFANWVPLAGGGGVHSQSGDALLWSGMYLASQAMRYDVTGSAEALANVKRVLDAMFVCLAITGDSSQFCRSVRPHLADGSTQWRQGAPPYDGLDWLVGGNNDMLHGLHVGFTFAWLALRKEGTDSARMDQVRSAVSSVIDHVSLARDSNVGEMSWRLLEHWVTGGSTAKLRYQLLLSIYHGWIVDQGNGVQYNKGVTFNASGLHLNLITLWGCWLITTELGLSSDAMRRAFEIIYGTRLGLFQLVAGTLGSFPARPIEVEDAVWKLREYPLGKVNVDYDRRIDLAFCMAPWPNNPWKNDWTTSDRTHGLGSYPLFERNLDLDYEWKIEPATYVGWAEPVVGGNADYLVAYWFARRHGVLGAEQ